MILAVLPAPATELQLIYVRKASELLTIADMVRGRIMDFEPIPITDLVRVEGEGRRALRMLNLRPDDLKPKTPQMGPLRERLAKAAAAREAKKADAS
jgi:hypothetical protein